MSQSIDRSIIHSIDTQSILQAIIHLINQVINIINQRINQVPIDRPINDK